MKLQNLIDRANEKGRRSEYPFEVGFFVLFSIIFEAISKLIAMNILD